MASKPLKPLHPRPLGARAPGLAQRMLDKDRAPVRNGYVRSFDGTKLFYSVEGAGQPLVFCYGLVCSSLHWTYQIEYFRKNYQVIWFDYRGHQNSDVPARLENLTLENNARDLEVILNEVGAEKPVLLGHSMGVNVVLEFYRQHPERVSAMVLANGTASRPLETLFGTNAPQRALRLLKRAFDAKPEWVRAAWKLQRHNPIAQAAVRLGGFNPHLTPKADVDLYVEQALDMDPGILLQLLHNYDSLDASNWLHNIHVPALIIGGENDTVIPVRQQELLHQLIPGSEFELIRHGSHCPQMDLPDLINLRIERFLRQLTY